MKLKYIIPTKIELEEVLDSFLAMKTKTVTLVHGKKIDYYVQDRKINKNNKEKPFDFNLEINNDLILEVKRNYTIRGNCCIEMPYSEMDKNIMLNLGRYYGGKIILENKVLQNIKLNDSVVMEFAKKILEDENIENYDRTYYIYIKLKEHIFKNIDKLNIVEEHYKKGFKHGS